MGAPPCSAPGQGPALWGLQCPPCWSLLVPRAAPPPGQGPGGGGVGRLLLPPAWPLTLGLSFRVVGSPACGHAQGHSATRELRVRHQTPSGGPLKDQAPRGEAGRGGRGPIHISWAGLGHRIPLPPQGTWWGWHRPWAGGSGRLLRGPLPGGSGPPSPALPLSGISLCGLGLPAVSETPGKENRSAGERKVARAPSAPGVGSSELGCTASYHLQGRRDTACGLLVEGHPPRP